METPQVTNSTNPPLCLEIPGWHTGNGVLAQWYPCNYGSNQLWQPVHQGGGIYVYVNQYSGKCLDVASSTTQVGFYVQQYTCHYGSNQRWEAINTPDTRAELQRGGNPVAGATMFADCGVGDGVTLDGSMSFRTIKTIGCHPGSVLDITCSFHNPQDEARVKERDPYTNRLTRIPTTCTGTSCEASVNFVDGMELLCDFDEDD
ncbi:MAG: RICIN domain-containing protein [Myxococcota bacterium]